MIDQFFDEAPVWWWRRPVVESKQAEEVYMLSKFLTDGGLFVAPARLVGGLHVCSQSAVAGEFRTHCSSYHRDHMNSPPIVP